MIYSKRLFLLLLSVLMMAANYTYAQPAVSADKIAAVVGRNRIILQSELDAELANARQENPNYSDTMKCVILQQIILNKIMAEQAERDSVLVGEEEVEAALDNRVRYFVSMYGSKEKLEQISGKTVYQLKDEYREIIREGMISDKMKGNILQNVKITPAEVQAFYKQIPADSLPFFPATVEMGEIVVDPAVSPELEQYARQKLEDIRKQIVQDGKSFEVMAGIYSEDPGSRDNGGDLGVVSRTDVVSEFAAAAFKLQNGEVSQIVKTKFGYHIIQMVRRQGDQAHLRHILIKPERTSSDYKKALNKLDSVRAMLITGKITFQEAVGKYATDEMSSRTGGMVTDPQTGSSILEVDKLDPGLALMVDTLKPGAFSQPQVYDRGAGDKSCRIVYMKSITTPHKANLKDDYNRIQEAAMQQKKGLKMEQWLREKTPSYYIKIAPEYKSCGSLQMWKDNDSKQ
ncbi:MAG: peptidylprolyl isomerase [Sphingobacteriales bacterium]|nr:MAG: peptidylprolyl isomerase [Sphingobacteriales bacterium]